MARGISLIGLALAIAPAVGFAQDSTIEAGQREFMMACAGCHGESALGDGPIAGLLNIDTPNLRQITQRSGGDTFPFSETLALIDGREVRAHGGDMPVWGDRYVASARAPREPYDVNPGAAEFVAEGRLLALVLYLESIQE